MTEPKRDPPSISSGLAFAMSAFMIWGASPVYWKALNNVPAFETVVHRVVWSFVFLLPLIVLQHRWKAFTAALFDWKTLLIMLVTSLFVSINWLIYIWAIHRQYLLQASLGYYINPLVNVLLGTLFLKERLRKAQTIAVALAAMGVLYLTVFYGRFPWVSIALAFSFGFYGLIRKMAPVGPLIGLTIETLLLAVPAVAYLWYVEHSGRAAFLHLGIQTDLMLTGTALVTALPLLFFNLGAKRLRLSTVGFLQYITPTSMFLIAVFFFKEPFSSVQVISFVLIWTALAIYSTDSALYFNRIER